MLLAHAPSLYRNPETSAPPATLAYDEYTKLMLHCDLPASGTSLLFDSSRSRHGYLAMAAGTNISAGGIFGAGNCLYIGGSPSGYAYVYGTKQSEDDFNFDREDFTIDWWEWRLDSGDSRPSFCRTIGTYTYQPFMIGYTSSGIQYCYVGDAANSTWNIASMSMGAVQVGAWAHLVFCRRGEKFMTFRNGVKISTVFSSMAVPKSAGALSIGLWQTNEGNQYFNYAYYDEIRISKGICRWTENFTPPIAPYGPKPDTQTLVLLHCDGDYKDASQYNHAPAKNSYLQPTAPPKFGTSALSFGDQDNCFTYFGPSGNDWDLGTQDFTFDAQINRSPSSSGTAKSYIGGLGPSAANNPLSWGLNVDPVTNFLRFHASSDGTTNNVLITGATAVTPSVYHHVAVTRAGGVYRLFLDGVLQGSQTYTPALYFSTSLYLGVGMRGGLIDVGSKAWLGSIDEWRLVKGRAEWVANFTPPVAAHAPFDDDPTVLLLHMEGCNGGFEFIDSSPKRHPMWSVSAGLQTSNGQAKYGNKSAIITSASALLFGNNQDWEFGAGDFTIDWWEYPFNTTSPHCVAARDYSTTYAPWLIYHNAGTGQRTFYASAAAGAWMIDAAPMGAVTANAWTHFAVARQGPTWRYFRNGVLTGSTSHGGAIVASQYQLSIGYAQNGNLQFYGHLDEFRITKGKALWTAGFTPPTAPIAPDGDWDTSLLLHFNGLNNDTLTTDSSLFRRNIAQRGTAKLSTAWSKFGASSAYFDGSANCFFYPLDTAGVTSSQGFNFAGQPFTIDFWMKAPAPKPICGKGYFVSGADFQMTIMISGDVSGKIRVQGCSAAQTVSLDFFTTSSTWFDDNPHHFALVRNGNVFTVYKDGVADGTQTVVGALMSTAQGFAVGMSSTTSNIYAGYIDEFRISNAARWTAPFTPPSAPYTV